MDDETAWNDCHIDDLWIFDKLILSKKLGYTCGPVGVDVPKPDNYILRPVSNICGMGIGAEFIWIDGDTDHLPPGYFWCEIFEGRHLSVDYVDGIQTLSAEGFRDDAAPLYKFTKWIRTNDQMPLPQIINQLVGNYKYVNVEFIDGHIIEIHLRDNPDFKNDEAEVIAVWEGDDITPPPGMAYVSDPYFKRIGFFKPI